MLSIFEQRLTVWGGVENEKDFDRFVFHDDFGDCFSAVGSEWITFLNHTGRRAFR